MMPASRAVSSGSPSSSRRPDLLQRLGRQRDVAARDRLARRDRLGATSTIRMRPAAST
jgi:hypothetical protein